MATNRKRVSKAVPAKGRLRNFADDLWKLAVRADWDYKCAVCGQRTGRLEAHHIIRRGHFAVRYELRNGILLCFRDHNHNDIAPHADAAGWVLWLEEHHPPIHAWYMQMTESGEHRQFSPSGKTADYFIDQILRLRRYVEPDDFERIVGVRFAAYLDSQRTWIHKGKNDEPEYES